MKFIKITLLVLLGCFSFGTAKAALDSTAEGCSKTYIYCGTYSFYTDEATGNQFTVFVSEDGEFIKKFDGHVKPTVNSQDSITGIGIKFFSPRDMVFYGNNLTKAYAIDINGDRVDSALLNDNWEATPIRFEEYLAHAEYVEIVDNNGDTYLKIGNPKINEPVLPAANCTPDFQYVQTSTQLTVSTGWNCQTPLIAQIIDLQTGNVAYMQDEIIIFGTTNISLYSENRGCYLIAIYSIDNNDFVPGAGLTNISKTLVGTHKFCK